MWSLVLIIWVVLVVILLIVEFFVVAFCADGCRLYTVVPAARTLALTAWHCLEAVAVEALESTIAV
jgi:hypothetical protein